MQISLNWFPWSIKVILKMIFFFIILLLLSFNDVNLSFTVSATDKLFKSDIHVIKINECGNILIQIVFLGIFFIIVLIRKNLRTHIFVVLHNLVLEQTSKILRSCDLMRNLFALSISHRCVICLYFCCRWLIVCMNQLLCAF